MGTLVMVGQLILSLSILIVLHEGGHFIPAKLFGTRVDKFYLFFDPWFSLFKFKKGETEYGIGWLPLGGYVKIAGMVDESFDTEQLKEEPQPWEFRSKPAWQRLIIMLGGVTVNFFLGMLIFSGMLWTWGTEYLPAEKAKYGLHPDSLGVKIGLVDGDKILKIGDVPFDKFSSGLFRKEVIVNGATSAQVKRDGKIVDIQFPKNVGEMVSSRATRAATLFDPIYPLIVVEPQKGSPAKKAGILEGDKVVAINGVPTPFFHQVKSELIKNRGKKISISVLRNNERKNLELTVNEKAQIGVAIKHPYEILGSSTEKYSFAASIPAGFKMGWGTLTDQVKAIGQMITNKISAKDNLGSVFTIAKAFGSVWSWQRFWNLTATLSLILAFMNLLPIPALDGGHVMFLLYEVISGRKPNDKFMEYATIAGFVFLVVLMIFIFGLDIWNNFIR